MTEHRLDMNLGFLTTHTLNLSELNKTNAKAIVTEIDQLLCVDSVQMNDAKQALRIAYDASHHNIDEMIAIVERRGAVVKNSWWNRTKLGWQRQTDENIKDNAKHEAACCSKMPPGFNNKR